MVTGSGTEYIVWETAAWSPRLRVARRQAGGLPGKAVFRRDGRVLALLLTRSLVRLIDTETWQPLATLESPEPKHVASLVFSPDGRRLAWTFNSEENLIWNLAAIREGLGAIGLDWRGPAELDAEPAVSPKTFLVEPAPWLGLLEEAERHARAGRWAEAVSAQRAAIEAGAPWVDAQTRLGLYLLAMGERDAYGTLCRSLPNRIVGIEPAASTANNLAWACAVGPSALDDYEPALRLARMSASVGAQTNRLNTLGAVLYRAGRHEEAIAQLGRSIKAHGAGGTPYDFLFLAMAHHRLGQREKALTWLARASVPAPIAMDKPDATGSSSWIPRLELEILRREAAALLDAPGP
jgi:tetratricopeptide (TPR) repeat protein